MRLIASVPEKRRDNQIEWLVLEDDPSDTRGFYLFFHRSLEDPSVYDSWHQTKELALTEAETLYGVTKEKWKSVDQLQ